MTQPPIPFTIRKAVVKDIPTILFLVEELAKYEKLHHEVKATESLYQRYGFEGRPYFETLLAETNDQRAVGFALYFFTFSTFEGRPTLYLEDIFVLPEFRQRGIGKALFLELINTAVKEDCGRMEWAVLNWNTPAIEFYESLGAAVMSEWSTFRLTRDKMEDLLTRNHPENDG